MKYRVKIPVVTEKPGFFGTKKVTEMKTIEVDCPTYRKMMAERRRQKNQALDWETFLIDEEIEEEEEDERK